MELVYLWIEDYECFKDTGFQFSNLFNFEYNKEASNLAISESLNKIENQVLFGKNIKNVSVIVGDNGSGKTSLLRGIIDFLATDEDFCEFGRFIGAFYDSHRAELKIFSTNITFLNLNIEECKNVSVNTMDINSFRKMIKETKLIYINNVLDLKDYISKKNGHVMDASVGGLLRTDFIQNRENNYIDSDENPIYNYFNNEIFRQLNFIYQYNYKDIDKIIPFELPNTLKVKILRSSSRLNDVIGELIPLTNSYYESENITPRRQEDEKRILDLVNMSNPINLSQKSEGEQFWLSNLVGNIFLSSLQEVARHVTVAMRGREVNCLLETYKPYQNDEPFLLFIKNYLYRAKEKLDKVSIYSDRLKPYLEFLEWLDINNFFEPKKDNLENDIIYINLNESNKERFQEFFTFYNRTCQPFYYMNFSWGLSTGENNLLSLYSRLYSALEDSQSGEGRLVNHFSSEVICSNVLLLIDEADLSFHPKWQTQYVDVLLKMVADLFQHCQVQAVLTTHSPILLSDVPKSNVIYLKNGENDTANNHQETFGQNIHTLFTDAFFLDKATGDFSKRIIKDVGAGLDEISKEIQFGNFRYEKSERLQYYKSVVSIIGEPIIRKAFEYRLKEVEMTYQTEGLKEVINLYNDLSSEDRDQLIQYIIRTNEDTNNEEN